MQQFFLGTHHPHWLGQVEVPLFVSRHALLWREAALAAIERGKRQQLSLRGVA